MAGARFLDPSSIPLKRQSGGNIWATLVHVTQAVIVIVLLSGLMLFFFPVIHRTQDLQEQKAGLLRKISDAQDYQEQLQVQTEHMKNDPAYVEHIARDKLGMGRPGETILRFDKYQPEPPPAKTPVSEPDNDSTGNP
jgi:cell division protein DivIC